MKLSRALFFPLSLTAALALTALAFISHFTGGVSPARAVGAAILAPFQECAVISAEFIKTVAASYTDYSALMAENDALREQISGIETTIREAELVLRENDELRQLLKMNRRYGGFTMIAAKVTASFPSAYGVTYTLNRGTADGVAAGNCVIVWEGLAGVVTAAGENWCEMSPVTDEYFGAAAMISRTGEACAVRGDPALYSEGSLSLLYLPPESGAYAGDRVITSGLGGLFPENILIGRILEFTETPPGAPREAVVTPAACIGLLSQVFVITCFTVTE